MKITTIRPKLMVKKKSGMDLENYLKMYNSFYQK